MRSSTNLIVTPDARQDLDDILEYTIATWGDDQADEYERILDATFKRIRSFPDIGRGRDDGVREYDSITSCSTVMRMTR